MKNFKEIISSDFLKNKINEEKLRALEIIFDNQSTLITARAGSGKTTLLLSLIYTLINCGVNKDEILLLSFNKKISEEISPKLKKEFDINNYYGASTFHSLAHKIITDFDPEIRLKIIEDQYGKSKTIEIIEKIVKEAKEESFWGKIKFKFKYWMYLKELDKEAQTGDEITTLLGEIVKSEGEKILADSLFELGVDYEYEKSYVVDRVVFQPDFTINDSGENRKIIIEFWGLKNPEYLQQAKNKRKLYKENNFILLEFIPEDISGSSFEEKKINFIKILKSELDKINYDIPFLSEEKKSDMIFKKRFKSIIKHIEDFIGYARAQCITPREVDVRLDSDDWKKDLNKKDLFFGQIANVVYKKYMEHLEDNDLYDFSKLLEKSAKIIEERNGKNLIKLNINNDISVSLNNVKWILVDEFQDFSPIFQRFVTAIQNSDKNKRYVCVGDDWQAINGFAGSDTEFMEKFEKYFPKTGRVSLATNMRSSREIVEAGNKIMSGYGEGGKSNKDGEKLEIIFVDNKSEYQDYENNYISGYQNYVLMVRKIIKLNLGKSICILSRTRKIFKKNGNDFLKDVSGGSFNKNVSINTIHSFKGNESDVVVILQATSNRHPLRHPERTMKFILGLNDDKIDLEERRLFYVAVTRAKEKLYILTEGGKMSEFITCLINSEDIAEVGDDIRVRDKNIDIDLHAAVEKGQLDVVKKLIKNRADLNIKNNNGDTALFLAAREGHLNIVRDLIKADVNIDMQTDDHVTALCEAAYSGHLDIVKELISAGANVNIKTSSFATILNAAVHKEHLDVVKELIKSGADVNIKDDEGQSPLHTAVYQEHLGMVKELIKSGADVNIKDDEGQPPLHTVAHEGHLDVARELIKSGADITIRDNNGRTALYIAAENNYLEIVQVLIKAGADLDIQDSSNGDDSNMKRFDFYLDNFCKLLSSEDKEILSEVLDDIKNLTWCYKYNKYIDFSIFFLINECCSYNSNNLPKLINLYYQIVNNKKFSSNFFSKLFSKLFHDGTYRDKIFDNYKTIEKLKEINKKKNPFISYLIGFCYLNIAELSWLRFNFIDMMSDEVRQELLLAGINCEQFNKGNYSGNDYYIFFSVAKSFINIFLKKNKDDEIANLLMTRCLLVIKDVLSHDCYVFADYTLDYYNYDYKLQEKEKLKEIEDDRLRSMDIDDWVEKYGDHFGYYSDSYSEEDEWRKKEMELKDSIELTAYSDVMGVKIDEVNNELIKITNKSHLAASYKKHYDEGCKDRDEYKNGDIIKIEDISF